MGPSSAVKGAWKGRRLSGGSQEQDPPYVSREDVLPFRFRQGQQVLERPDLRAGSAGLGNERDLTAARAKLKTTARHDPAVHIDVELTGSSIGDGNQPEFLALTVCCEMLRQDDRTAVRRPYQTKPIECFRAAGAQQFPRLATRNRNEQQGG